MRLRNESNMTVVFPIKIHKPNSCHGWGIDFKKMWQGFPLIQVGVVDTVVSST